MGVSLVHRGDTTEPEAKGSPFIDPETQTLVAIHTSRHSVNSAENQGMRSTVILASPWQAQLNLDRLLAPGKNETETPSDNDTPPSDNVKDTPAFQIPNNEPSSGSTVLYICLALVAGVWVAVLVLMRKMAR